MKVPVIYRHELGVCLRGRWFRIAAALAALMAVLAAGEAYMKLNSQLSLDTFYVSNRSVWANWILSDEAGTVTTSVFCSLAPLLAVLPYAWSMHAERISGYDTQILARIPRMQRLRAKLFATFCSGAVVTGITLVLNFLILAPLLPANIAFYEDANILGIYYDALFAHWFYNAPWLYVMCYTALDMFLMGCWAALVLSLSVVLSNRVSVMVVPYLALYGWNYMNAELSLSLNLTLPSLNLIEDLAPSFFLVRSDPLMVVLQVVVIAAATIVCSHALARRDVR